MNDFIDYYQLLEVNIFSSKEAIKASYKRLALKYHPDTGGDKILFMNIAQAYQTLSDDLLRKNYLQEWKSVKFANNEYCKYPFTNSYDDIAFQPVRETVHEYMFYIMNGEYNKAYYMLCMETKKKIFKSDFIKWQELVGVIHKVLSFESSFETIESLQPNKIKVVFLVKVMEYNILLNRQEEDFFKRILVFEENNWKIRLHNIHISQIIKKYKQIISIYKKRTRRINRQQHYKYHTKYLDDNSFKQNVEYEFLRYKRYQSKFGLLSINIDKEIYQDEQKVLNVVEANTRITDSYCFMGVGVVVILMPEAKQEGMGAFKWKLINAFKENQIVQYTIKTSIINETVVSSKDMINNVIFSE